MNKIKKIIKLVSNKRVLKFVLSIPYSGYLKDIGWIKSWSTFTPQEEDGKPLPWVTYSFIEFIKERLNKDMKIFEYGTGNSTKFYSDYCGVVESVEHDKEWFEKVKKNSASNAIIHYEKLEKNGLYSKKIQQSKDKFDLIIIDGRDRVNCIYNCINNLSENGVIVLDDSERDHYRAGKEYLKNRGYKELNFWGLAPGVFYNKCTSIYYHKHNVLDI